MQQTILRKNDLRRVSGYEAVQQFSRKTDNLVDDIYLANLTVDLLPKPAYHMSALYAAAYDNDAKRIAEMARLDINPNLINPESGYAAIHIAAARGNAEAVAALVYEFGIDRIDINLVEQNSYNSALHIAIIRKAKEIVDILCDQSTINPFLSNKDGQKPLDICYIMNIRNNNQIISHAIWQVVQVTCERVTLEKELAELTGQQQTTRSSLTRTDKGAVASSEQLDIPGFSRGISRDVSRVHTGNYANFTHTADKKRRTPHTIQAP